MVYKKKAVGDKVGLRYIPVGIDRTGGGLINLEFPTIRALCPDVSGALVACSRRLSGGLQRITATKSAVANKWGQNHVKMLS